jgi:hypothetical protein
MDDPPRSSFPQHPEEFDADPRVSFSKVSSKFILEADDGQEYEYDDALKRWVPVVRLTSSQMRRCEGFPSYCEWVSSYESVFLCSS